MCLVSVLLRSGLLLPYLESELRGVWLCSVHKIVQYPYLISYHLRTELTLTSVGHLTFIEISLDI